MNTKPLLDKNKSTTQGKQTNYSRKTNKYTMKTKKVHNEIQPTTQLKQTSSSMKTNQPHNENKQSTQ